MKVTIEIPESLQASLSELLGSDFAQAAKEALAIAWYREEKLSIGQVAEFLGMSVYEADGLMKSRNVEVPYSMDEFDRDRAGLDRLLNP